MVSTTAMTRPAMAHFRSMSSMVDMALRRFGPGGMASEGGTGAALADLVVEVSLAGAFDVDESEVTAAASLVLVVLGRAGMGAGAGSGFSGGSESERPGFKKLDRRDVSPDDGLLSPLEDAMALSG
jgi:hypothetical protein